MITVSGLRNCDTCRRALAWLEQRGIDHSFVDLRADGVAAETIARWARAVGWEVLLNRRGTTWRGLDNAQKDGVDKARAIALMAAHPALIKRPVFEAGGMVTVGFDAAVRQRLDPGTAGR